MFKKIVVGALAIGLIAVLAVGAVNRTSSKSSEQGGGRQGRTAEAAASSDAVVAGRGGGGGQGRGWQQAVPQAAPSQSPSQSQNGGQGGRGQDSWGAEPSSGGVTNQGGQGKGRGYGQLPEGTTQQWQLAPGVIVGVTDDSLTVKTHEGALIEVEGRPLQYLLSQGYAPQVGSQVTLAGFEEDGEFKVGELTDHSANQKVQLRDAGGRPMWSGRGQRG